MSVSVTIREAHDADLDALVELLGGLFDDDAAALPGLFARAGERELGEYWAELLAGGTQRVFVAVRGNDIAGVLTLEEVRREATLGRRADHHAFIHFLAVAPTHRRQGIATKLLQHARQWSADHGFHKLRLHVWEHNETARRLYERAGYATLTRTMEVEI